MEKNEIVTEFNGCIGIDPITIKFSNENLSNYFIKLDLEILYCYTDIKFGYRYIYIFEEYTTGFVNFDLNNYVFKILNGLVSQKDNNLYCIDFLNNILNNEKYYEYVQFQANYGGGLKYPN